MTSWQPKLHIFIIVPGVKTDLTLGQARLAIANGHTNASEVEREELAFLIELLDHFTVMKAGQSPLQADRQVVSLASFISSACHVMMEQTESGSLTCVHILFTHDLTPPSINTD